MDDKFLIHVELAGKNYGLRILRSEEEVARAAARQLQQMLDRYRQAFSYREVDIKDLLAMVAFQLSMDNLELKQINDATAFARKLEELTGEVEDCLEKNK